MDHGGLDRDVCDLAKLMITFGVEKDLCLALEAARRYYDAVAAPWADICEELARVRGGEEV